MSTGKEISLIAAQFLTALVLSGIVVFFVGLIALSSCEEACVFMGLNILIGLIALFFFLTFIIYYFFNRLRTQRR